LLFRTAAHSHHPESGASETVCASRTAFRGTLTSDQQGMTAVLAVF